MAKKNYHNIGSMNLKKKDHKDDPNEYYIKLDQKMVGKIYIEDEKTKKLKPITEIISVERPTDKFDRMIASGKMTPEEYEQKIAMFSEGGKAAFVKFNLQASTED
jgi:hypothetical protein